MYYFIILCTVFDFGDCSIDICLFYCIVFVCCICLCVMCFSDKFHVRLLYDRIYGPTKLYVCMYVCIGTILTQHGHSYYGTYNYIFTGLNLSTQRIKPCSFHAPTVLSPLPTVVLKMQNYKIIHSIFNHVSQRVPNFSGNYHVWKKYNRFIKGELDVDLKSRWCIWGDIVKWRKV